MEVIGDKTDGQTPLPATTPSPHMTPGMFNLDSISLLKLCRFLYNGPSLFAANIALKRDLTLETSEKVDPYEITAGEKLLPAAVRNEIEINSWHLHRLILTVIYIVYAERIDRMHKWQPKKYSFVFVLISLTSLISTDKIRKKSSFRTRLVGLISTKTKEYFFGRHLCIPDDLVT